MALLNAAVIGLGVGARHIEAYERHPDCRVTALCDFDEAKLAWARQAHPQCQVFSKADEILNDPAINVVSIATYDNYHADQILQALSNGKHVFVEKPLCLYEEEAKAIRQALTDHPELKLSSNLILRHSPRFLWLKEMVREGELGRLYYLEGDYNYGRLHKITRGWRGELEFYSAVYGGGVHMIDLMMWLSGEKIVEVTAMGNRICSQGSRYMNFDLAASLLRFDSGMIAKMTVNFGCVTPHFHELAMYGTKATFRNGPQNGWLISSRDSKDEPFAVTADYPGADKGDLIPSFIESIIKGGAADVETDEVFDAMSVCFAIEKSLHQGGTLPVNYI